MRAWRAHPLVRNGSATARAVGVVKLGHVRGGGFRGAALPRPLIASSFLPYGSFTTRGCGNRLSYRVRVECSFVCGGNMTYGRTLAALAALGFSFVVNSAVYGAAAAQQRRAAPNDCRDYKQKGGFGIGGVRPSTSDGRVLTQCRECWYEVRRFFPDKKVCAPWPVLPNGSR